MQMVCYTHMCICSKTTYKMHMQQKKS